MSALIAALLCAAPAVPAPPQWAPPAPVEVKLLSGATAWVHARPGVPLVHIAISVAAGSAADPLGQPGLAALTATALEEGGAGDHDPKAVLAAFDALGTELHVTTSVEETQLTVTVLASRLEPAVRELAALIAKPRFDAAVFDKVRARRLAEIADRDDDPQRLARHRLFEAVFAGTSRDHDPLGTADVVAKLTVADAKQLWAARWAPKGVKVVMVGDVTAAVAGKLLDQALPKTWGTAAPLAAKPAVPAAATEAWLAFDRPGAPQTVLAMGRASATVDDPKSVPLQLAAMVLGGSFTSRLVQNLREKHGYTYGVGFRQALSSEVSMLRVSTSVKTEVTAEAMEQLLLELKLGTPFTPAERVKARALLAADQVQLLQGGDGAAQLFAEMASLGVGPDGLAKRSAQLDAINDAQLATTRAELDPTKWVVVIVGDKAKIEAPLKKRFPSQAIRWR